MGESGYIPEFLNLVGGFRYCLSVIARVPASTYVLFSLILYLAVLEKNVTKCKIFSRVYKPVVGGYKYCLSGGSKRFWLSWLPAGFVPSQAK